MDRNQCSGSKDNLPPHSAIDDPLLEPSRREFMIGLGGTAAFAALSTRRALAQASGEALNVARVAVPTSLTMASENKISALNDGFAPANSLDRSHPHFAVVGGARRAAAARVGCNTIGPSRSTSTRSRSIGLPIVPGAVNCRAVTSAGLRCLRVTGFFIGMGRISFRFLSLRDLAS